MYRLLYHLKFFFKATNHHGVHSPFVYSYVTKCLYKKEKINLPIAERILVKSILYFDFKSIWILGKSESVFNSIQKYCPEIVLSQTLTKLVYINFDTFNTNEFIELDLDQMPNNGMFIIKNIHTSKKHTKKWECLKHHNSVRVTLDLFYCGIIFFRQEQVKEHFKIKI